MILPFSFQLKTPMGLLALENDSFDGQNYLVSHTKTGNSIKFVQRIVRYRPVINSKVLTSFLYKTQYFILFGLVSKSPQFFFTFVLAPISWLLTGFHVLANCIYSSQWILHSWVGLQVAANVLCRWLHKSRFIAFGGDSIPPWGRFSSPGSWADSPGHTEANV